MSNERRHFGPFTLDITDGLLFRDGERVHVRPQAMRVLMRLVEHQGELVSRHELTSGIWADLRIDEHQGLNAIIRHLRRALGDDASDPTYIETIPTKGYRFIAACVGNEPVARPRRSRVRTVTIAAAAGFVIVASILAAYGIRSTKPLVPTLENIPTAARQAYVEGLQQFTQGHIDASQSSFEKVVAFAPSFAEGHLWLGNAVYGSALGNLERATQAEPHLLESLRLNPRLPGAYVTLGRIALVKDLDVDKATNRAERALALDADHVDALELLLEIRAAVRDFDGALEYLGKLDSIDPLREADMADRGWLLILSGDYESAALRCRDSLRLNPENPFAMYCLFEAYFALDAKEFAQKQAVEFMRMYGAPEVDTAFVQQADYDEALERFFYWRVEQINARVEQGGDPFPLIITYWRLGLEDQALTLLKELVDDRNYAAMIRLSSDTRLDHLSIEAGVQKTVMLRR